MKILVTGGAGFVGSHLCERLVSLGHEVVSLDNYFTGSERNHVEGVAYYHDDTKCLSYHGTTSVYNADLIYHLGEYSRVEQSFDDIDLVHEYNIQGTFQVLEFARRIKAKLVYAGSSTKFVQEDNYIQSPYAWSKASNTELVKRYHEWYGLEYAITYFYNVFGPRENSDPKYGTLIARYAELSRQGKELPVTLPGSQKRNFTHVDDIVDALVLVGERGQGDEYGIGNPDKYSVLEVAEMFGGKVRLQPTKRGNRTDSPLMTEKTKALGWKCTRRLPDYIKGLVHDQT